MSGPSIFLIHNFSAFFSYSLKPQGCIFFRDFNFFLPPLLIFFPKFYYRKEEKNYPGEGNSHISWGGGGGGIDGRIYNPGREGKEKGRRGLMMWLCFGNLYVVLAYMATFKLQ